MSCPSFFGDEWVVLCELSPVKCRFEQKSVSRFWKTCWICCWMPSTSSLKSKILWCQAGSSTWHFTNLLFCQLGGLSICHISICCSINLAFNQLAILSTLCFIHFIRFEFLQSTISSAYHVINLLFLSIWWYINLQIAVSSIYVYQLSISPTCHFINQLQDPLFTWSNLPSSLWVNFTF